MIDIHVNLLPWNELRIQYSSYMEDQQEKSGEVKSLEPVVALEPISEPYIPPLSFTSGENI